MKNPTKQGKYPTLRRATAPNSTRTLAPFPGRRSVLRALAPAVFHAAVLALFLYPGTAPAKSSDSSTDPAAASPAADPNPAGGIRFDNIHLGLAAHPPAACTAPLYGTLTARGPDGALCLCHQSYGGKQGLWEQIGTGKACWPDKK
jgi:hypothetical protein